jgi:hypothetical protein
MLRDGLPQALGVGELKLAAPHPFEGLLQKPGLCQVVFNQQNLHHRPGYGLLDGRVAVSNQNSSIPLTILNNWAKFRDFEM